MRYNKWHKGSRPEKKSEKLSLSQHQWLDKFIKDYPSANSERLDRLYKALPEAIKLLTPSQQYVIHENFFMGRTLTQIADQRGVNKSTICKTRQRAIKRLKTYLQFLL